MLRNKRLDQARYAGQEYVKWAGYSPDAFDSLVTQYYDAVKAGGDVTQLSADLETYLKLPPLAYGMCDGGSCQGWDLSAMRSAAQAGVCVYRSPAPFETEYQGNIFPGTSSQMPAICAQPGGGLDGIWGTPPPTPTFDQLVKWGQARADYGLLGNPAFTTTYRDISIALGIGGVTGAAITGGVLGTVLAPVMAGTAFQLAVFPYAGLVSAASSSTLIATGSSATNSAAIAAANAGAVGAAGVAAIAAAVIFVAVVTTVHLINLLPALELPGKLHTLIVDAATGEYDLRAMLNDTGGTGELYNLFVQETLPAPMIAASCDNDIGGGAGVPCLNPPPVPEIAPTVDPLFMVTTGDEPEVPQRSITWRNKATEATTSARLHGVWFVQTVTDYAGRKLTVVNNDGVARQEFQSLRIMYTDWDDTTRYAWLVRDGDTFTFVSNADEDIENLNHQTCVADGTCEVSDTIYYQDQYGNKQSARVVLPLVEYPVITSVTFSPANPEPGEEVTFSAQATSPAGVENLTFEWTIQDKPLSAGLICSLPEDGRVCYPHSITRTGSTVTHSFTDADLRGAVVVLADLRQAVWGNTLCPDGTNSDANGGTCLGHLVPVPAGRPLPPNRQPVLPPVVLPWWPLSWFVPPSGWR